MSFSMNCEIVALAPFRREAKKLIKKYPSLQKDLAILASKLTEDPAIGTPLGHRCYKVRLSISSKGKGKSGGARVITYLKAQPATVFLIAIYDKTDQEAISDRQIKERLSLLHKN